MTDKVSTERLAEIVTDADNFYRDEIKAMATELLSLRNAQSEAVAVKASCPSCNGTGDLGGNPSYGRCDDCGGTGWLSALTHPAPPLAVTDEMVEALWKGLLSCPHTIEGHQIVIRFTDSLPGNAAAQTFERLRTTLTAALEAKQ